MTGPVLAKPEYLTLPEAVALVCPPLPEAEVRRAIEEALCDGRLSEVPRPLWTAHEAETFVAAAFADERDFARARAALMLSPPTSVPAAWQSRFRDSRVDWQTGSVATAAGYRESPVFSRESISMLFATPEPIPAPKHPGGRPAKYDGKLIEPKLEDMCRKYGGIPSRVHPAQDWRTVADACRFVREVTHFGGDGPADSTLRALVSPMLKRIAAKLGAAEN